MTSINNLSPQYQPLPQDQIAVWAQGQGQPRRVSLSAIIATITAGLQLPNGLLNASTLYALRRTQNETLALTTLPAIVAPYDANGNSVLQIGGTALTQNVVTGVMQATRVIEAADFWVTLIGSLPSPRVMTLQLQTGPVGGTLYTSEFQAIATGTGAAQSFHFAGILQNPNNPNGQINIGDQIQLVASADQATTLTINRATMIVQPLDGV